jgi:hypothetical protein
MSARRELVNIKKFPNFMKLPPIVNRFEVAMSNGHARGVLGLNENRAFMGQRNLSFWNLSQTVDRNE